MTGKRALAALVAAATMTAGPVAGATPVSTSSYDAASLSDDIAVSCKELKPEIAGSKTLEARCNAEGSTAFGC